MPSRPGGRMRRKEPHVNKYDDDVMELPCSLCKQSSPHTDMDVCGKFVVLQGTVTSTCLTKVMVGMYSVRQHIYAITEVDFQKRLGRKSAEYGKSPVFSPNEL